MRTIYAAITGYALLASGCSSAQCQPDCKERTSVFERAVATCARAIQSDDPLVRAQFAPAYVRATEQALGTPHLLPSYDILDRLDARHFSSQKETLLDLCESAEQLAQERTIRYERQEEQPPYRTITKTVSVRDVAEHLRFVREPRTRNSFLDGLKKLFGWMFIDRRH